MVQIRGKLGSTLTLGGMIASYILVSSFSECTRREKCKWLQSKHCDGASGEIEGIKRKQLQSEDCDSTRGEIEGRRTFWVVSLIV